MNRNTTRTSHDEEMETVNRNSKSAITKNKVKDTNTVDDVATNITCDSTIKKDTANKYYC